MDTKICNIDEAPGWSGPSGRRLSCCRCGGGDLRPDRISTAFWRGEALVVIRGIPARVCADCGEQFVDDRTVAGLHRMQDEGFADPGAAEHMVVPVFDYACASGSKG